MGIYRTAQVCLNGHTATNNLEQSPEMAQAYCSRCGKPTISECPRCGTNIRGYYYIEGVFGGSPYNPPKFCFNCGEAFPWTAAKIEAARELANELDELSTGERQVLRSVIDDLSSDTPKTELAAHRFKRIAEKLGDGAKKALTAVVMQVATEAAKRAIFGG